MTSNRPVSEMVERAKALREALLLQSSNIPGPDQIDWCAVVNDYHAALAASSQAPSDDVVERVAEAIWEVAPAKFAGFRLWHEETPKNKQVWAELARAAIAAIPSAGGVEEMREALR